MPVNEEPSLAGASLYPSNRPVLYTQTAVFNLQLCNPAERMIVRTLECEFPADEGLPGHLVRETCNKSIERGHTEPFQISFTAELHMRLGTQQPKLRIEYERGGQAQVRELQAFSSVVLEPMPARQDGHVFISHKDPENRELARDLKRYLRRAGLESFIAEDLPRPGMSLWKEKLPPAVRESRCVTVLWTPEAAESAGVRREIELAEEHGKRIILARQKGCPAPASLPRDIEYYDLGPGPGRREMATLAQVIWDNDKRGHYST